MSFFDEPEPPEPPKREPHKRPAWSGPADGVLPAVSDQRVFLVSTPREILVIDRFLVYPTGLEFTLTLFTDEIAVQPHGPPWEAHHLPGSELSDDLLRFGVLFADGTKWTNVRWDYPSPESDPTGPLLLGRGGGGGGSSWQMRYWMWPLPPPDTISFVTSWPARNIAEQTIEVDITDMLGLASQAEVIWPGRAP